MMPTDAAIPFMEREKTPPRATSTITARVANLHACVVVCAHGGTRVFCTLVIFTDQGFLVLQVCIFYN